MPENDLCFQTKGFLILVPGIFGVLSNITLMLIILSIASAQRYCPRNVTSLFEQKPLYLRNRVSVSCNKAFHLTWLNCLLSQRPMYQQTISGWIAPFENYFSPSDDSSVNTPASCCITAWSHSARPWFCQASSPPWTSTAATPSTGPAGTGAGRSAAGTTLSPRRPSSWASPCSVLSPTASSWSSSSSGGGSAGRTL